MTTTMITTITSGLVVFPYGCEPDDANAREFQITITWRGRYPHRRHKDGPAEDWYSVENNGQSLSRAGNWHFNIQRFQYQQHRFSLEEAIGWAHRLINDVKVYGHTWAEWEARDARIKAEKEKQEQT